MLLASQLVHGGNHDGLYPCGQFLRVAGAELPREDGIQDPDPYNAAVPENDSTFLGHDLACAVNQHGQQRLVCLHCKLERARLELSDSARQ